MSRSTLNPFEASTTAENLREWLLNRNRTNEDKESYSDVPLAALTRPGMGYEALKSPLATAFVLWENGSRIRKYSSRKMIATFEVDDAAAWNNLVVRHYLGPRLIPVMGCAVILGTSGIPTMQTIVLTVVALAVSGWAPIRAALVAVAAAIWLAFLAPSMLIWLAAIVFVFRVFRAGLNVLLMGVFAERPSSPLAFLGSFAQSKALVSPLWSSVTLAVDKATSEDRRRTRFFLDAAREHDVDGRFATVLQQCEALACLATPDYQKALALSEHSRTGSPAGDPALAGWLAAQHGDILNAAGESTLAEQAWRDAADLLLSAGRRGAYWWEHTQFRLASVLLSDLNDTARCLDGLRIIYRLRRRGIRRGSHSLIRQTENCMLPLMYQAGNGAGAAAHFSALLARGRETSRSTFGISKAEVATEQVLLAALILDSTDHSEEYSDIFEIDDRAVALEAAAEAAANALFALHATPAPTITAQAYAVLAEVLRRQGNVDEALGNALAALNIVQHVRYQLPTARWRQNWVARFAATYQLALQLAWPGDAPLVAELLEVVRAQSVPMPPDLGATLLRSSFESLLSTVAPATPGQPGDAIHIESDPLLDSTPLVMGASWVGGDSDAATDFDGIIGDLFPLGWYWSFARVGDHIVHAWRDPQGKWFTARTSYQSIELPLRRLLLALPIQLAGEESLINRLLASPLFASDPDQTIHGVPASQALDALFNDLAPSIPPEIRQALSSSQQLHQLVVAPIGSLCLIPLAMLPVDRDRRLMDVATIVHMPALTLVARRAAQPPGPAGGKSTVESVIAVVAPDHDPAVQAADTLIYALKAPRRDRTVVTGPLRLPDVAKIFNGACANDQLLHISGHVDVPDPADPGSSGLRLAGGNLLTLRSFYKLNAAGGQALRVPRRVVLAGCQSMGVYRHEAEVPTLLEAPEWLGLGAAVVYGGAEHVYCTLFPIPEDPTTTRIEDILDSAMLQGPAPELALREVQRGELLRWRRREGSMPMVFLAFAYVGIGGTQRMPSPVELTWESAERHLRVA